MKILHVITSLKKAAGTSVFCAEVCNGLVAAGHDVAIAVRDITAKDCCPLDIRIKLIPMDSLVHTVDAPQFDVVHVHAIWTPILHKVSDWARRNNLPVVWSPHGMLAPWAMRHKWWKKFLPWHLYQKYDLKRATLLHATSKLEERSIRELGFVQPIVIAPIGTSIPTVKPMEAKACRTLLFVGRIYPVKGLVNLIKAWALCNVDGWKLRIVGPDQAGHLATLKSLVSQLSINTSVDFVGPRFGDELSAEYDNCDCLVLPSFTENFGATIVDALAHGKPCIASTFTPWRDLQERACGWWVSNEPSKLSAAIGEMISLSDAERSEMGVHGMRLIEEKYTWDAAVKTISDSYLELLNER